MSKQDYSLPLNKVRKFMNKTFRMHNFECARIDKSRQDREGTSPSSLCARQFTRSWWKMVLPAFVQHWQCSNFPPILVSFVFLSLLNQHSMSNPPDAERSMATCTLLFQEGSQASEHHSALIIFFKLSSLLHFFSILCYFSLKSNLN